MCSLGAFNMQKKLDDPLGVMPKGFTQTFSDPLHIAPHTQEEADARNGVVKKIDAPNVAADAMGDGSKPLSGSAGGGLSISTGGVSSSGLGIPK